MPAKIGNLQKLVEAVKSPLGYLTLFLAIIGIPIGTLTVSGRLAPQGNDNVTYALVASAVVALVCFLYVLIRSPDLLFRQGPIDATIAAFRDLDKQLTPHDMLVLQKMLGDSPRPFYIFTRGVLSETEANSDLRQKKLMKLGFIQKVGTSEVELSALGVVTFRQSGDMPPWYHPLKSLLIGRDYCKLRTKLPRRTVILLTLLRASIVPPSTAS